MLLIGRNNHLISKYQFFHSQILEEKYYILKKTISSNKLIHGICSALWGFVQPCGDLFSPVGICSALLGFVQSCGDKTIDEHVLW